MHIKYLDQNTDLKNKNVLARFDFNVPIDSEGNISDTSRIDLALPTIKMILSLGAKKVFMMSHLGRPKGEKNPKYSLEPVAVYLAKILEEEVVLSDSTIDTGLERLANINKSKLFLIENLRFEKGEKENDRIFAGKLAKYGEIYINDAFGVMHRKHASVHDLIHFFPNRSYGGLLVQKEVSSLSKVVSQPGKPFIGVIGGAKVSDKIKTIERMLITCNNLLIGGAMAYPFLKAKNIEVGKSMCSEEDVILAKKILKTDKSNKIVLPLDHKCVSDFSSDDFQNTSNQSVPESLIALDIGEKTIAHFSSYLSNAKTIFWNGPMGLFERKAFSEGTFAMAKIIAESQAFSVVGGGDSVSAVNKSGKAEHFSHISTGGGASLEFIEKGSLPGMKALQMGVE